LVMKSSTNFLATLAGGVSGLLGGGLGGQGFGVTWAHLTFVELLISRKTRKKRNRSFHELRSPEVFLDRPARAAKMLLSPSPFFDGDRRGF
jgi:hypothetical protein